MNVGILVKLTFYINRQMNLDRQIDKHVGVKRTNTSISSKALLKLNKQNIQSTIIKVNEVA